MEVPTRWRARRRGVQRRIGHHFELALGLVLLSGVALLSIVVPLVSVHGPLDFVAVPLQPPSWAHLFGTDEFGRDMFVRIFAAGRTDLAIAAVGVGFSLVFGTLVGIVVAVVRVRVIETVVMRLVDALIAIPFIILVLALVIVMGSAFQVPGLPPGLPAVLIAVLLTGWTIYARLARAETLAVAEREYVIAARVLGYSRGRIVLRYIFPTVIGVTATYAAADAIMIVIATASLAFLGAGVQPPAPEWGNLMFEGKNYLATAWWITVIPGLVLAVAGLGLTLIADVLVGESGGTER